MARITQCDALKRIPNRFDMTLVAVQRARQLLNGAVPHVYVGTRIKLYPNSGPLVVPVDKPAVIALREIAAGRVGCELLKGLGR